MTQKKKTEIVRADTLHPNDHFHFIDEEKDVYDIHAVIDEVGEPLIFYAYHHGNRAVIEVKRNEKVHRIIRPLHQPPRK